MKMERILSAVWLASDPQPTTLKDSIALDSVNIPITSCAKTTYSSTCRMAPVFSAFNSLHLLHLEDQIGCIALRWQILSVTSPLPDLCVKAGAG
jgi:hypothetical protein